MKPNKVTRARALSLGLVVSISTPAVMGEGAETRLTRDRERALCEPPNGARKMFAA